jgi:hypothetical protein
MTMLLDRDQFLRHPHWRASADARPGADLARSRFTLSVRVQAITVPSAPVRTFEIGRMFSGPTNPPTPRRDPGI